MSHADARLTPPGRLVLVQRVRRGGLARALRRSCGSLALARSGGGVCSASPPFHLDTQLSLGETARGLGFTSHRFSSIDTCRNAMATQTTSRCTPTP